MKNWTNWVMEFTSNILNATASQILSAFKWANQSFEKWELSSGEVIENLTEQLRIALKIIVWNELRLPEDVSELPMDFKLEPIIDENELNRIIEKKGINILK